ncbi:AAA family ATPase [Pseudomonas sp. UL073]|uniref:AAA family ATPase n=1 Tax=Zestomonas insulae TaxID=2809017 RepID=A0ABS2IDN2_9GAMM|nr:AAA family ATPase [Pseudomonas insulae]MBM7061150.1 AAA family ATPase [Pseudomonas insulae]
MTSLHADEAFLGHYQFSHDPFAPRVPGFKFFPAQRKPVLGQLHHLARYSQLLLVVTGPEGSGKTLLRQALVASTNKQTVQSVVVSARGAMDAGSLLRQVAQGVSAPQSDIRGIQAQVMQLTLTGQEVYLLVDDAEQLDDSALDALLALATGNAEARPHIFLFGQPALLPRLELLTEGEERFHAIELQPYSEDETAEYLAQRLDGAGQGIDVFTAEQVADIHAQAQGWPGLINQVARETLIEAMLAQRGAARPAGLSLQLPKKHLLALAVVVVAVAAALLMKGRSGTDSAVVPVAQQAPAAAAAGSEAPQGAPEGGPAIEFAGSTQPLPLPLVGEAQPVIRQPLAQVAGQGDGEEASLAEPAETASPTASAVPVPAPAPITPAPTVPPAAPVVAPAVPPVAAAVPAPAPRAPTAAPVQPAAPAVKKPAVAQAPVVKPAPTKPAASGGDWYASQAASHYALQILGTRSEASAQAFVRQQGAGYRYFVKSLQGKPLFVVTYGSFASRGAAQAAIKGLPAKVQAGKPWPRTFASIQQEARSR